MRAVILAAGLGTRLRAADRAARLTAEQERIAAAGVKPLMPILGRPFVEYQLEELTRAGVDGVCVVVAARHRELWRQLAPCGVEVAVQAEPRGTADALVAAEGFTGAAPFLMLNGDTWYASAALAALVELDGPGVVGFDRHALASTPAGNIRAERIAGFALLEPGPDSTLARVIEKPDPSTLARCSDAAVGVNCWRFSPAIFDACRAIRPSLRGELEITAAVQWAINRGLELRLVRSRAPLLDLSSRRDVAEVERLLRRQAAEAATW